MGYRSASLHHRSDGNGQAKRSLAYNRVCSTLETCKALATKRLHLLGKRERRIVALLVRIHKLRANSPGARARPNAAVGSPASVICSVFGSHCSEAISVATCESHLNIWAVNGQYVNLFQMGYNERRRYGWHVAGSPAILAARAAYRYFLAAGGWGPWQCKP